MRRTNMLIFAAELSLTYNIILLLSVTMNYDWVRTRAAGGGFDSFPTSIRIAYFFMAAFMGALMFWLWDKRNGINTIRGYRFATTLAVLFSISTVMQLISRSSDERWNAIPAAILAITFWVLRNKKD
ncbi:MAG: hypothetical protein ACKOFL_03085 [Actinomycetota bacterium]